MRVLVACEYSGRVRDSFTAQGHDAWSCDLLPTEQPGQHYEGDVRDILDDGWDLMIAHPDCQYLATSAAWAFGDGPYHQKVRPETLVGAARRAAREKQIAFVVTLMAAPIRRKAIENPVGVLSTRIRKPDQIIQPHEYGEDASKRTCLWLENLPLLEPTCHVEPRMVDGKPRWANQSDSGQNNESERAGRWKDRARTYQGWADAFGLQWGACERRPPIQQELFCVA